MSKPPAFQFYVGDWVLSTRTLSIEEKGVYIELLAYAWDHAGLPEDLAGLPQFCGVSKQRFTRAWGTLRRRWRLVDGRWVNGRQEREREKQREWREKSAKGGRASAQARAKQS